MKKRTPICILLTALLLSSCASSEQFYGTMAGSTTGGLFGSVVGGITGGWRGHETGQLAGMLIGGAVGAAATAPKTHKEKTVTRAEDYGYADVDAYNRHERRGNERTLSGSRVEQVEQELQALSIENLCFIDENHNHAIDAGEHSQIQFEVRNNGRKPMYHVTPVLSVQDNKRILVSPSAIIASIAPGKAVRYTANVYAKPSLKNGVANFALGFMDGNLVYTERTFQLNTHGKR